MFTGLIVPLSCLPELAVWRVRFQCSFFYLFLFYVYGIKPDAVIYNKMPTAFSLFE